MLLGAPVPLTLHPICCITSHTRQTTLYLSGGGLMRAAGRDGRERWRRKKSLTGKSLLKPFVQSIFLETPWEGAGQWEDFHPKLSGRNPDLLQTEPKTRPTAHLRAVNPAKFLGTQQRGETLAPLDFEHYFPHKEPDKQHRRKHTETARGPRQMCRSRA